MPLVILFFLCVLTGCSKPAKAPPSSVSHVLQSSKASSSEAEPASSAPQVSSSSRVSSKPSVSSSTPVSSEPSSAPRFSKHITLTIDASKGGDGVAANSKQVGINAGDSVYTVLKRYCDANKIMVAGSSNYVSAIDGVSEFDHGSGSGWIYCVNGTFPQIGCGAYKLNGGESVKWIYTVDYGKTEEGK